MKICSRCKVQKELTKFGKRARAKDGLQSWCNECRTEYRIANRERIADYAAKHKTPDEWREYHAAFRQKNRDRENARIREWRAAHPEKVYEWTHNSQAKRRGAVGDSRLPSGFKEAMIAVYGPACLAPGCERTDVEFDHVVPLTKGGSHSLSNGQLLCKSHNVAKGNRHSKDYRDHSQGILVGIEGGRTVVTTTTI